MALADLRRAGIVVAVVLLALAVVMALSGIVLFRDAEMVHRLATPRSWSRIIVVTWRYHLPRARIILRQCFSPNADAVVMQAVPRQYDFSLAHWQFIYAYQYAAFAKAEVKGDCKSDLDALSSHSNT